MKKGRRKAYSAHMDTECSSNIVCHIRTNLIVIKLQAILFKLFTASFSQSIGQFSFYSIREGREKEMNICVIYFYEQKILSDRLDEVWTMDLSLPFVAIRKNR